MALPFTFGSPGDTPLLLLHGLLGSFEAELASLAPLLAETHFIAGIDFRMHGSAAREGSDITLDALCDDVIASMSALQLKSAHIAGYSLGGFVGLALAHRRPDLVRSVFMHGTKFYWTDDSAQIFAEQMQPEAILESQPRWATRLASMHGDNNWRTLCLASSAFVRGLPGSFAESDAKTVSTPVCVSVGDRDNLVPVQEATALARALPSGSLCVLPNTKHPFQLIDRALFAHHVRTAIDEAEHRRLADS